MKTEVNAIILAAGKGTRLRPITDSLPKPLIKVCGRPLLDIIIGNLKSCGIGKIAINSHYYGEKLEEHLKTSEFAGDIELFHEPEILGTGGPMVNAGNLLKESDYFILHNGDIITDLDLSLLLKEHQRGDREVTMLLRKGPENKVLTGSDGTVLDILGKLGAEESEGSDYFTYCGIMIISRKIFDFLPAEPENYSIITAVLDLMRKHPGKVKGMIAGDIYWNDLGTIKQYFQVHKDILIHGELPAYGIKNPCVSASADIAENAEINGFLAMGDNCRIKGPSFVNNCILLDGAVIEEGEYRSGEIIAPELSLNSDVKELSDLEILKDVDYEQVALLVEQGSDRRFYRLKNGDKSLVLVLSSATDADFERFIQFGQFFDKLELPTPKLFDFKPGEYSILVEDLGDDTVYRFLNKHQDADLVGIYRKIIDALVDFQLKVTTTLNHSPAGFEIRNFDYDYLRWESDYFQKNLLEKYSHIEHELLTDLSTEFDDLARFVSEQPKIFMHRDFQSQNIMLHNSRIRFVDFQGARMGPLGYDIMSLLRDPYLDIPKNFFEKLSNYYFGKIKAADFYADIPEDFFNLYLVTAGLQRNMQALGAYGFLGLTKNKQKYLNFIPQGLKYLRAGLEDFKRLEHSASFKLDKLFEICENL
jgi:NDP-sugar pyrophosphorylase family protein/aminoglycoside/choline kinase family phosphotransferase